MLHDCPFVDLLYTTWECLKYPNIKRDQKTSDLVIFFCLKLYYWTILLPKNKGSISRNHLKPHGIIRKVMAVLFEVLE